VLPGVEGVFGTSARWVVLAENGPESAFGVYISRHVNP
jgi:hypothetical protein